MSCAICGLLGTGIDDREVLCQNDAAIAWLHESMAHRGHSVIAARRHVENLSDLMQEEADGFLKLARGVERAVLAETGAERAILMKLGLQVPHLHLHIYPVRENATREHVMQVIDGRVTDDSSRDEKKAFAERVRALIVKGEIE
jgi:diadenosine tetraphosphate (Ap4A) HIT family hydrolase